MVGRIYYNLVVESMAKIDSDQISQPLPDKFRAFGWVSLGPTLALALRTVYEQTVLTWEHGLQAIGFALFHEYIGFALLGIAGELCLYIWLSGFLIMLIQRRVLHKPVFTRCSWVQLASSVFVLSLFMIPYGWWQFATIEFAGPGNGAVMQLTSAAAENQQYLVKSLLRSGPNVDSRNSDGITALDNACKFGQESMANYLLSKGAIPDHAPSCRKYREFAVLMKVETPVSEPDDGLIKVPGTTIEVHSSDKSAATPSSER